MDYFDLYYAYLARCEKENWENMRDPNHDYMEWNHTLPQCIFGDQPIGQWLTKEQHAIASALQTLAWKKQCICGFHKKLVPGELWGLCLPFYVENSLNTLFGLSEEQLHKGRSNPNSGIKSFKGKYAIFSYDKDERIEINRKGGQSTFNRGVGAFSPEHLGKGCKVTNSQLWASTLDGFVSTAAGVASHNKSIGGTGKDKVQLSQK
jgi:hypothetical protein